MMTQAEILQENSQLKAQLESLKQQLDWFKRQLFGRKSEQQIDDNPYQEALF